MIGHWFASQYEDGYTYTYLFLLFQNDSTRLCDLRRFFVAPPPPYPPKSPPTPACRPQYAMPASLVTESKDFEPDGPADKDKDTTKIKVGTWEFYHFNNHQIYLHVQPKVVQPKVEEKLESKSRFKSMEYGDGVIGGIGDKLKGASTYIGDKLKGASTTHVECYTRNVDRDVKYFFQKFLQRTMDEDNNAISNTKCSGNARLD